MKNLKNKLAAVLFVLVFSAVSAAAQVAIKTNDGFLFVYNNPTRSFSLDIKGKSLKALKSENSKFIIDDRLLQIVAIPLTDFAPDTKGKTDEAFLEEYKIWESTSLGVNVFKTKLTLESEKLTFGQRKALLWGFARPNQITQFVSDHFLTTRLGDYLVVLFSSVKTGADKKVTLDFLNAVMRSIKVSDQPFDIQKLANQYKPKAAGR